MLYSAHTTTEWGDTSETPHRERVSPLPTARAFVVQLSAEADMERKRVEGRVEHVISGRATHSQTLQELTAFMRRVLGDTSSEPGEEP